MTDSIRLAHTPAALRRSIPFWLLLAGSLASFGYGGFLVLDKISTMTATLANGSATGVDVYVGQSWIVVGAAFIGAGLLGLVTVVALAVVRSLIAAPAAPAGVDEATEHDVVSESPLEEALTPATTDEAETVTEPAPEVDADAEAPAR
jgi:hypothetical protein